MVSRPSGGAGLPSLSRLAPAPGSWPWLLAHELRLLWRSFGIRSRFMTVVAAVFVLLAHGGGYLALESRALETMLARSPGAAVATTILVCLLVLSSAFGLAVRVLFERGDLDLLVSSPIPMTTVYAVRGIAVGMGSVASMAFFLLPLADMGPFAGQWRKLGAWPALGALGLLCASIALAVLMLLVRWLGLRRARIAAQLVGAFVGVGFVLAMQVPNLLPAASRAHLRAWGAARAASSWLGSDSPLLWPFRAFMGEGAPLAGLVAVAIVSFVVLVRTTHGAFLRAAQEAPQVPAARAGTREALPRAFRSGLVRVVMAKELTLVARDPMLIAKTLLQLLYLVPLLLVTIKSTQPLGLVAAALVVLASGLAGTLAWITVSGEEAPDLLASAPVSLERVRWLKVAAALVPVAVVVLPFLGWYAHLSVFAAGVAAVFVAAALASSAVVQVWATPLGGGRDLRKRHRQNPFVHIADTLSSFGWGLACYLAVEGSPWLVAGVLLGLSSPAAAWLSARRAG